MSAPQTVLFNQGEQILSSDFNNLQSLSGQELSDLLARFLSIGQGHGQLTPPPTSGLGTFLYPNSQGVFGPPDAGGVLAGLDPTAFNSGVGMFILGGLGFRVNNSPPTNQSTFQWIKNPGVLSVPLTATASAQIALIEVTDASIQGPPGGVSRNVWNSTANAVQASTLFKQVTPQIAIGTSGVAGPSVQVKYANSPTVPTVDAGYIPVAYVTIPANAISTANSNVIDVRRFLMPGNNLTQGIVGAGLALTWTGTNSLVNQLTLSAGSGLATGVPVRIVNDLAWPTTGTTLVAAGQVLGDSVAVGIGSGSAANKVFYCYACPSASNQPISNCADQSYTGTPLGSSPGALYGASTGMALVLSNSVAPNRNGAPSAAITVAASVAPLGVATTVTNGIFVGSVVTDSSGNIIPFRRAGNEVLFVKSQAFVAAVTGGNGSFAPGGGFYDALLTTSPSLWKQTIAGFGPGGSNASGPNGCPASATHAIMDVMFNSQSTGTPANVLFQDGHIFAINTTTGVGNHQATAPCAGGQASLTTFAPILERLKLSVAPTVAGQFNIYFSTPHDGTTENVGATMAYMGYVEPITRLGI